MVLFALVVVVILGTIGLVIEMGTVRVTRERMQSAADAVALEVLRERDFDPEATGDAFVRDRTRRERNRVLASWTFASEQLPSYEESEQGAGPYIDMTPSQPGPDFVNRSLILNEVGHSVPVLRTNYDGSGGVLNKQNGDIVSGTFTGHEGGSIGIDENPIYREAADYERVDFTVADGLDAPTADSVLVRLRRTVPHGWPGGPWSDLEDDVSSSGWTMPLVFGLGSTFIGTNPEEGYSIRHHGLPLRATAIAQAKPAVRIGAPLEGPGVADEWNIGAGPLAFRFSEWNSDVTFGYDFATGRISGILRLRPPSYELNAVDHDVNEAGYLYPKQPAQVGDLVDPQSLKPNYDQNGDDTNLDPGYWAVQVCYVPLYIHEETTNVPAERHICGFARVQIDLVPPPPDYDEHETGDQYLRVTKLPNIMSPGKPWMAGRNASATFDGSQPSSVFPSYSADWDDVVDALYDLSPPASGPATDIPDARVYAPAHVR